MVEPGGTSKNGLGFFKFIMFKMDLNAINDLKYSREQHFIRNDSGKYVGIRPAIEVPLNTKFPYNTTLDTGNHVTVYKDGSMVEYNPFADFGLGETKYWFPIPSIQKAVTSKSKTHSRCITIRVDGSMTYRRTSLTSGNSRLLKWGPHLDECHTPTSYESYS